MNLLEVWEKTKTAVCLWSLKNLSLKRKGEVCALHIYSILLYWLSMFPQLVEGGLGMLRVEMHQYTLCISFLDWMCVQNDGNNNSGRKMSVKHFQLFSDECSFNHECQNILGSFLQAKSSLSVCCLGRHIKYYLVEWGHL